MCAGKGSSAMHVGYAMLLRVARIESAVFAMECRMQVVGTGDTRTVVVVALGIQVARMCRPVEGRMGCWDEGILGSVLVHLRPSKLDISIT